MSLRYLLAGVLLAPLLLTGCGSPKPVHSEIDYASPRVTASSNVAQGSLLTVLTTTPGTEVRGTLKAPKIGVAVNVRCKGASSDTIAVVKLRIGNSNTATAPHVHCGPAYVTALSLKIEEGDGSLAGQPMTVSLAMEGSQGAQAEAHVLQLRSQ